MQGPVRGQRQPVRDLAAAHHDRVIIIVSSSSSSSSSSIYCIIIIISSSSSSRTEPQIRQSFSRFGEAGLEHIKIP